MKPFKMSFGITGLGVLDEETQSAILAVCSSTIALWTSVIKGWPDGSSGESIDHLKIELVWRRCPEQGGIAGEVDPDALTVPFATGPLARLPAAAVVQLDRADVDVFLQANQVQQLRDTLAHEVGHALGIGTIWNSFVQGADTDNPVFIGPCAMKAYAALKAESGQIPVPLEKDQQHPDKVTHWKQKIFLAEQGSEKDSELMTPFVAAKNVRLSRLTVAALSDLGYLVRPENAEEFKLP